MERKTKQRILGLVVIIGLVVILFPLFRGKEMATQRHLVEAPPFPDQSVQVNVAEEGNPVIPVSGPSQEEPANGLRQEPDDIIKAARPSIVNAQESASPVASNQPDMIRDEAKEDTASPAVSQSESPNEPHAQLTRDTAVEPVGSVESNTKNSKPAPSTLKGVRTASYTKPHPLPLAQNKLRSLHAPQKPLTNNGLVELKNAAWVIQIGSFKNKTNAVRIVNRLRANGYPAFIQQISTALGENTRVFVGPSTQAHSARALAERLETDMHIRGIVISYKPLTL